MSAPRLLKKLMEEWLLLSAALLLIFTSLYLRRIPGYDWNDFHVLYILFVFLVIVRGMEESGILYRMTSSLGGKYAGIKMVAFTGFISIFVTNDIALFLMVPLTLSSNIRNKADAVIMETLSVNALSSISPVGNPQNIFIYYHYGLGPFEFIRAIAPLSILSFACIMGASYILLREDGDTNTIESEDVEHGKGWIYAAFFLIFLTSMFGLLPLWIGIIPLAYALVYDRRSLNVDYLLLATFFVFFGLSDNIHRMLIFTISSSRDVFLYSALASQFMSNVPSALLFSDFTGNWSALLWGVSVGGFGTLIASMANLISYRFYRARTEDSKFLPKFHAWSFAMLFFGALLFYMLSMI